MEICVSMSYNNLTISICKRWSSIFKHIFQYKIYILQKYVTSYHIHLNLGRTRPKLRWIFVPCLLVGEVLHEVSTRNWRAQMYECGQGDSSRWPSVVFSPMGKRREFIYVCKYLFRGKSNPRHATQKTTAQPMYQPCEITSSNLTRTVTIIPCSILYETKTHF